MPYTPSFYKKGVNIWFWPQVFISVPFLASGGVLSALFPGEKKNPDREPLLKSGQGKNRAHLFYFFIPTS